MGGPDLFNTLTRSFKGGDARVVSPNEVRLTPYLSIVIAILYMMAADGEISERESSQLQSVIGADDETLRRAVAYVSAYEIDQFLQAVPPLLDEKSRLCLLLNVCDSLMADGKLASVELALFDRLLKALGHTQASFQSYYDAIAIKDTTSVLGEFDVEVSDASMSSPMALVVSLLYMMSVDGSVSEEEIGRLNAVGGISQSMLKASLRYVSKVRAPQFLASAATMLDERQRLCILLNASDTMLSDGVVANAELQLFQKMQLAFGFEANAFDRYLNILRLKNDIPKETAPPRASREHAALPSKRAEGEVFERKQTWEEEAGDPGKDKAGNNGKSFDRKSKNDATPALEAAVSNTMQDNIDRLVDQFDDEIVLDSLEHNARDESLTGNNAEHSEGSSKQRAYQDAEGEGGKHRDGHSGPKLEKHLQDASASDARRALNDADADAESGKHRDSQSGPKLGKHLQDASASDARRALNDVDAESGKHRDGQSGPKLEKHLQDASASDARRALNDTDGESDKHRDGQSGPKLEKHLQDASASDTRRALNDAEGEGENSPHSGSGPQLEAHWQDGLIPGGQSEMSDAGGRRPSKNLMDDRKSFDASPSEDDLGPWLGCAMVDRVIDVSQRTRTIQNYVEAMLSAKSIAAASRLPLLPMAPIQHRPEPAITTGHVDVQHQSKHNEWDDGKRTLLASDEGGPIMSQSAAPLSQEEAKLNRRLRRWSAVLLPALFVTYGSTMVGETTSERMFVTSENMATDARIVHQMSSVQQTVYRVAPEAVTLSVTPLRAGVVHAAGATATSTMPLTGTGSVASVEELSDREKADSFLERRKQELMALFQQHQGASALAAERQQWFVYAKSVVLLGLGMAFWGVLFRSMSMLHAATAVGIAGLLLTMNGYWLIVQF